MLIAAVSLTSRNGKALSVVLACFQKESVMGACANKDMNTEKPRTSKISQRERARQTAWEEREQGAGNTRSLMIHRPGKAVAVRLTLSSQTAAAGQDERQDLP